MIGGQMGVGPTSGGYQVAQGVEKGTGTYNDTMPGRFSGSDGYDPYAALLGRQPGFAEAQAQRYAGMANDADARATPDINRNMSWGTRQQALQGIDMLQQRAMGIGMSPGEAMARRATTDSQNTQLGMAASARGGPQMAALAARNAQNQYQTLGTQGNLQAQQIRAQDMENARSQLFQATSGLRGQDIGAAQFASNLDLQNRAANDKRAMTMLGMEQNTWNNQRDALMQQQGLLLGDQENAQQRADRQADLNAAYSNRMTNMMYGGITGGLSGGASLYQGLGGGSSGGGGSSTGYGIIRDNPYDDGSGSPSNWTGIY